MTLPIGTVIYIVDFKDQELLICRRTIVETDHRYLKFIFDENDKLWATEWVREIWDAHPHRHPYASLFTLLYKKLEF